MKHLSFSPYSFACCLIAFLGAFAEQGLAAEKGLARRQNRAVVRVDSLSSPEWQEPLAFEKKQLERLGSISQYDWLEAEWTRAVAAGPLDEDEFVAMLKGRAKDIKKISDSMFATRAKIERIQAQLAALRTKTVVRLETDDVFRKVPEGDEIKTSKDALEAELVQLEKELYRNGAKFRSVTLHTEVLILAQSFGVKNGSAAKFLGSGALGATAGLALGALSAELTVIAPLVTAAAPLWLAVFRQLSKAKGERNAREPVFTLISTIHWRLRYRHLTSVFLKALKAEGVAVRGLKSWFASRRTSLVLEACEGALAALPPGE